MQIAEKRAVLLDVLCPPGNNFKMVFSSSLIFFKEKD